MSHSFCFIGCGAMSARHIASLRRLRPRARLAVASRNADRAQAFARAHGVLEAFGSYEQAIASNYETVVIATPPNAHRELVEEALAQGKHILVEKPIFSGLNEFIGLWPKLEAARGVVMVAENEHFSPFHRALKQSLSDGGMGAPIFFELSRLGNFTPKGWRADAGLMPLGALHEGGVHWVRRLMDLASVFESEIDHVIDVSAFGPMKALGETPHEDTTIVVARHLSGLTTRLLHTWALPHRFFDLSRVELTNGALYFDTHGKFGRAYRGTAARWIAPAFRDRDGYLAMWKHFLACLEQGVRPEVSLSHIFADFAYLEAALEAKASGRPTSPRRIPACVNPPRIGDQAGPPPTAKSL